MTKNLAILPISLFLYKENLHHLILLRIWGKISQVIDYGCLYSSDCPMPTLANFVKT
jgi:hypothetical protein